MAGISYQPGQTIEHDFDGLRIEVAGTSMVAGHIFHVGWRLGIKATIAPRRRWTSLWLDREPFGLVEAMELEARFVQAGPALADVVIVETDKDCGTLAINYWLPKIRDLYPDLPRWRRLFRRWPSPCHVHYRLTVADADRYQTFEGELVISLPSLTMTSS